MKELVIEWRHYDKGGKTCDRCAATGTSVGEAAAVLERELAADGVAVRLVEKALAEEEMAQSNSILLNGTPLEELLEEAAVGDSPCPSCSCLTGSPTSCRTIRYGTATFEEIPRDLILQAARKALAR